MRDRVRESAIASLLASKRFIVSVCAAIAMVLGAVSAGASVFTGTAADAQPQMPVNSVFNETSGSPSVSNEAPLFTKRQTLASQNIAVQPPQYTVDAPVVSKEKKGLNLKLNQDVVKTTNALFYNPEASAPEKPETVAPPAASTDPPISPSPETTLPAGSEPPAEPATVEPQNPTASPPSDPTTEPSLNSVTPPPTSSETKPQS